jgi:hypothetical protein
LIGLNGFLEIDFSNDDNNDSLVEDMTYGEGLSVEEVFGDEYIEYDVMLYPVMLYPVMLY